jgi:YesN/AraC family two-component response regulator
MKEKILIIDDELAVREALYTILKEDFTVLLAATVQEGLNILSNHIRLILLDIMLPDLNGLEALRMIKDKYPSIPVVIITAYSTEEACITAFRSGARDFIRKPFNAQEIKDKAKILTNITSSQGRQPFSLFINNINNYYQNIPEQIQKGILKVKDYISKNYVFPLNINSAAKMAGINRAYFCRYFKLITGCTFKDYLVNIRLKTAKELLKNKKLKINNVAEQSGYSPKYFSEVSCPSVRKAFRVDF